MITECLCTIGQQPKFCCRMSAPLPLNDVLLGQCTSFSLPQACCFTPERFIWCLPTSALWKNCKSVPFTFSMLSVIRTVSHQTSPSSEVSPFNLLLCRSCSMSRNKVLLHFTRSFPLPLFPLRQDIGAVHTQCRRGTPGVQAAAWHYVPAQSRPLQFLPSRFWPYLSSLWGPSKIRLKHWRVQWIPPSIQLCAGVIPGSFWALAGQIHKEITAEGGSMSLGGKAPEGFTCCQDCLARFPTAHLLSDEKKKEDEECWLPSLALHIWTAHMCRPPPSHENPTSAPLLLQRGSSSFPTKHGHESEHCINQQHNTLWSISCSTDPPLSLLILSFHMEAEPPSWKPCRVLGTLSLSQGSPTAEPRAGGPTPGRVSGLSLAPITPCAAPRGNVLHGWRWRQEDRWVQASRAALPAHCSLATHLLLIPSSQSPHFCLFHVMLLFSCINKSILDSRYQPI